LDFDGTQNPLNNSSENVSPDSSSIFSTEPNNTPSSNAHPSEPSEDEFKATLFTSSSPAKIIFDPNAVHLLEPSEVLKATPVINSSPPEEDTDASKNPKEQTTSVEEERDEIQNTQSVLSEEDMMSRCSNAYDGSISSSDEGKINIHDRSYYLQKSRRTFRKKAPAGDKRKDKEGLPPRPPNEKFGMRYGEDEVVEGVSLDSNDFQMIQSLIESEVPHLSLIGRYKKADRFDRLRNMDELRDKLNKFSKQREGDILYHQEGIDSTQRLHHQNPRSEQSPLCFDLRHNSDQLKPPYPYIPPPLPSSHCACVHCTNGLFRPNSCNLCISSSFPGSPISIDQESTKSSSKDKRAVIRKHICRPIFGGTPYVICENCFNLLQVPSTILISKKRLVELQCGNCSEVLTVQLPLKKFIEKKVLIDLHGTVMQGGPVPSNTHYGASYSRSYSTGGESAFNGQEGDREATLSALHRLMGYNSATELIYSHADVGYDSFESMVPHSRTRPKNI
jgi:Probable zinc-ribbon domain